MSRTEKAAWLSFKVVTENFVRNKKSLYYNHSGGKRFTNVLQKVHNVFKTLLEFTIYTILSILKCFENVLKIFSKRFQNIFKTFLKFLIKKIENNFISDFWKCDLIPLMAISHF